MSGDGVLIRAVITVHLRLPPAQVPALRMMRDDGGAMMTSLTRAAVESLLTGRPGITLAGSCNVQQIACWDCSPRTLAQVVKGCALLKSQRSPLVGYFGVFSVIDRQSLVADLRASDVDTRASPDSSGLSERLSAISSPLDCPSLTPFSSPLTCLLSDFHLIRVLFNQTFYFRLQTCAHNHQVNENGTC